VTSKPLAPHDERHLLDRVAAGDERALREVIDRYGGTVFGTAARLLGSEDDADDVVQDVFIGLPAALGRYDHQDRFDAWLRRLAARLALIRLRRARRRARILDVFSGSPRTSAPADVAERIDLEQAIRELPEELRIVFVLKVVVGHTHGEIGQLLGIRRGTSEVRLFRAIRRLRTALGDPS